MIGNVLNKIKLCLVKFYYTRIGRKVWCAFVRLVNSYYLKRLLQKALNVTNQTPVDSLVFPPIAKSDAKKNALVIMPFYGADAVGRNCDSKVQVLKNLGYCVHTIVYNNSPWDSSNKLWDYTYNIKATEGQFGQLQRDVNQQIITDGNRVDDWVDERIVQFVGALSATNQFDVALINYVFLSKLCTALSKDTVTMLDTHDVFANRNTRMKEVGVSEKNFYFSTSKIEESKGLSRADYIIAIQEAEGKYFRETTDSKVIVQPPMIASNFFAFEPKRTSKLVVGFMASGHYPNVVAIKNLIRSLSDKKHNIRLDITGTICGALDSGELPNFVQVLGFCENLEEFYKSCDLIVNPDELLSGMKVKCLEALSFGVPLVSTKAGMEGIETSEGYHQFGSADECTDFMVLLEKNELRSMAIASQRIFEAFNERYDLESTLKTVLHNYE
jgi:glycosyltransferase involved in cell wall biosynthesis